MKKISTTARIYLILIIIIILSLSLIIIFDNRTVRNIMTISSIVSILSMAVTFILEMIKRTIDFLHTRQLLAYEYSSSSNIAYDINKKYLDFCECYIQKVYDITGHLFQHGNSKKTLELSWELTTIRRKFAVYIPEVVHDNLYRFEYDLRVLGAEAEYQENTLKSDIDTDMRNDSISKTHKMFLQLMDLNSKDESNQIKHYEDIIKYIRETTGIEKMFKIKEDLLKK